MALCFSLCRSRHKEELELLNKRIKVYRYKDILNELENSDSQVNSTAGNIVEKALFKKLNENPLA